jgi:hypothetical protein
VPTPETEAQGEPPGTRTRNQLIQSPGKVVSGTVSRSHCEIKISTYVLMRQHENSGNLSGLLHALLPFLAAARAFWRDLSQYAITLQSLLNR